MTIEDDRVYKTGKTGCVDCGKLVPMIESVPSEPVVIHRCESCQIAYDDRTYLDKHSGAVIKESADRTEDGDHQTHEENEAELDKILEDY